MADHSHVHRSQRMLWKRALSIGDLKEKLNAWEVRYCRLQQGHLMESPPHNRSTRPETGLKGILTSALSFSMDGSSEPIWSEAQEIGTFGAAAAIVVSANVFTDWSCGSDRLRLLYDLDYPERSATKSLEAFNSVIALHKLGSKLTSALNFLFFFRILRFAQSNRFYSTVWATLGGSLNLMD